VERWVAEVFRAAEGGADPGLTLVAPAVLPAFALIVRAPAAILAMLAAGRPLSHRRHTPPLTAAVNPSAAMASTHQLSGKRARSPRRRVVVAMSGGVDSSVVAGLLSRQGHDVIGVTLQLYDHGEAVGRRGCCAGQDIHDAR